MDKEPRDYRLARRAYEAFMGEQPQVWFDQLSHDFQMRWVRAARSVQDEQKRLGSIARAKRTAKLYTTPAGNTVRRYKHSQAVRDAWAKRKRDREKRRKADASGSV